jgi:hypothetical protein
MVRTLKVFDRVTSKEYIIALLALKWIDNNYQQPKGIRV